MFGIGKKDKDGKQVRIEHRGKHVRASRTGGVAVRAEDSVGPVNVTVNTARGVRVSTRVARGARMALQNGRFQLIGRWNSGPLAFNVSKSGASASAKTEFGRINFIKPRYSSFKFAGVQVRGQKAVWLQLIAGTVMLAWFLATVAIQLLLLALWLAWLFLRLLWDLGAGFLGGFKDAPDAAAEPRHREAAATRNGSSGEP